MSQTQTQQVQTTTQQTHVEKPTYQKAIDEFKEADAKYKELEEYFNSGSFLPEGRLRTDFLALMESIKSAMEDRNAKLQTAQNAFRDTVKIPESQWRGPEGKPSIQKYAGLEVSSVTHRGFDPQTLFQRLREKGASMNPPQDLVGRLLSLTGYDKQSREYKLVEQEWKIDYDAVKSWLIANNLQDVFTSAYNEEEKTPRVSGAKALAYLGDKKKD